MRSNKHILLTIDVEDWFQVENFKPWIPYATWDQRELRVERNVHQLLDLFDSIELNQPNLSSLISSDQRSELNRDQLTQPNQLNQPINNREADLLDSAKVAGKHESWKARRRESEKTVNNKVEISPKRNQSSVLPGFQALGPPSLIASKLPAERRPKATFFVLAWLADRLPSIVRDIQSRGHEIASHGCNHELSELLSADELKQDLTSSKKLLEDITGVQVAGYRAPSFAINDDILKIIEDAGYFYDSSYNSFGLHGRYGKVSLNGASKKGIAHKLSNDFYELPISNLSIKNPLNLELPAFSSERNVKKSMVSKSFVLPFGGGGYFRLTPYRLFRHGVKAILKKDEAYVFYMHPWEIDPEQPKVNQADFNFKIRHYTNLGKTKARLRRLIESFDHCNFVTCSEYLEKIISGETKRGKRHMAQGERLKPFLD